VKKFVNIYGKFKNTIAFVVATKDRPVELRNMLKSLEVQSYKPDQVIIVDGSAEPIENVLKEFPTLSINYIRCIPPSAARQRNMGIKAVNPEIILIGFLDDDTVLEADSLEKMMEFWENASDNVGGVAFNMVNHPPLYASWLKSLPLTEKLGLYSKDKGKVLPSGFHTMIGFVSDTIFVQWLPTTATVWHRKILEKFQFDEWFEGYSYLEDLDFSYKVNKDYRLAVVADARYYHYPASSGRDSGYIFGKREVANRLYFVKKNKNLSLSRCYLALLIRMFMSISLFVKERKIGYLQRVWGNIVGLGQSLKKFRKALK
jgi:GT2 family glycosyltransferase